MIRFSTSKRLLDLGVAVVGLPFVLVACAILLIAIRLESPGNPLIVQRRVGRGEHVFRMLKLRTMTIGTSDLPSHEVEPSRITRLGGLLRKAKLDELPQLLNVLVGQMTLIGPRPCLPSQTLLIAERASRGLFDIPPGITGPAQLVGIDMSDPPRLATVEAEYFSRATLRDDVRIALATVLGRGFGDAARAARERY